MMSMTGQNQVKTGLNKSVKPNRFCPQCILFMVLPLDTELRKVKKEISDLKKKLNTLQDRKSALEQSLKK